MIIIIRRSSEDRNTFNDRFKDKIQLFQKNNKVTNVTKRKSNITHEYGILYPNNPKELTKKE